jgi:hypothetical protein
MRIGRRLGKALKTDRGEQKLRLDVTALRRLLEPTHAFRPARRDAYALDIATPHPIFGIGKPGARRAGVQSHGGARLAGGKKRCPAADRRPRRQGRLDSLQGLPACQRHVTRRAGQGSRIPSETTERTRPSR